MTEVFGVVMGALSVAGLFNNCVDCFEYIQFGRSFGPDYERCQLRLDVARTRLGRWGAAAGINDDPRFSCSPSADDGDDIQLARSLLEDVAHLFDEIHKKSKRYRAKDPQDLVPLRCEDMQPGARGLRNRLRALAQTRQKRTGLVRKSVWALYDKKWFERMIDDITTSLDDLEKVFPVEAICRRLAEMEVDEIGDEPSLFVLRGAAEGVDIAFLDAAARKMDAIVRRNFVGDIKTDMDARLQVGNLYVQEMTIGDLTSNSAEKVVASGRSRVQVGNIYGGKGIWE